MMDEDLIYAPSHLDRDVVNPDQIRTVIRSFKENLFVSLFPHRQEVPKTLIFAKTDSHADDIINIVREEFGEGNEFCKKITCTVDKPETVLSAFRNEYNPRIAVTVDMIATGTDVKSIECLVFMRDVRSSNYFEQMKGRGTRVLCKDDLQKVTPSAIGNKDHFVIVDAVGVTKSTKTETRHLECKPSVCLKDLMLNVALGARDESTLTSLGNRIIRLDKQMSSNEKKEFQEKIGIPAKTVAGRLLNAFDNEIIAVKAGITLTEEGECSPEDEEKFKKVQDELITEAVAPFHKPEVREFIENVRKSHEQVIDNENLDKVVYAGFDVHQRVNADNVIQSFRDFIEENKDEITALGIIYDQRYKDRPMAIKALRDLYAKLTENRITVERLWDCYAIKHPQKVKQGVTAQLTDLISIIRFEMMEYTIDLAPFADRVNYNFQQWTLRRNAGPVHFSEEQMKWLRLIRDHIAVSLSIEKQDLDLNPFDNEGGLGKFYDVFGDSYETILREMNMELVV
jgi:type I restriction enzyme R subunit